MHAQMTDKICADSLEKRESQSRFGKSNLFSMLSAGKLQKNSKDQSKFDYSRTIWHIVEESLIEK